MFVDARGWRVWFFLADRFGETAHQTCPFAFEVSDAVPIECYEVNGLCQAMRLPMWS